MLQASNRIKVALVSAINSALGVPVKSVLEPSGANRYVYIQTISETALDEKRAFITEGVVQINIIEKFEGRSGNMTWVDSSGVLISTTLTPNRLSTFGDLSGINIFTMRIADTSEELRETPTGRTAVKSLRLEYKAQ